VIEREDISTDNTQASFAIIVSLLLAAGIAFLIKFQSPPSFPVVILLAFIIFITAFVRTDVALIILILSMLLSPEFSVGGITGRSVVIRADDIFLIVIFLGWLAKMAINKELGLVSATSLSRPVFTYLFICLIASGISILQGYTRPEVSFFYLLKYFEYFFLFFMVSNSIKSKKEVKMFLLFLILTCIIVTAYGWQLHSQGVSRIAAPFDISEGGGGEANTLAGYLLLMISVIIGLSIYCGSLMQKILLLGLLGFMVPTFLFTQSRGAWLGFFPMYFSVIILTKKARPVLLVLLLIIVLALPLLSPQSVKDRVTSTFVDGKVYTVFGKQITFEPSAAARIENWKNIIKKWSKRPFLGYGVTGVGLVDSQYALVLGETGLIGLLGFIWLMTAIFRAGKRTFNLVRDDWARGLTLGFLAGFIGLLVQALSANIFIIVRVMGPFWFLAALIVVLPRLYQNEELCEQ
jgi:O-antigen ligase